MTNEIAADSHCFKKLILLPAIYLFKTGNARNLHPQKYRIIIHLFPHLVNTFDEKSGQAGSPRWHYLPLKHTDVLQSGASILYLLNLYHLFDFCH